MRVFLNKLVKRLFIVLIIVLAVCAFSVPSYLHRRVPIIKLEMLKSSRLTDSIALVLGSSHSFYGINTNFLNSNYFNAASVSQGFYEDFEILNFTATQRKVTKVILPISYFSNHHYLDKNPKGGERLRIFEYSNGYELNYSNPLGLKDYLSIVSSSLNQYFVRKEKFDKSGNLLESCQNINSKIKDAKDAFHRHNLRSNFDLRHPYLDSILNYCNRENISLHLLIMPFTKEYNNYLDKSQFNSWLIELRKSYPRLKVFDNRKIFVNKNESNLFRDADHLSPCGRNIFSEELRKQLAL